MAAKPVGAGRTVFVLGGGGALGAYQAGVIAGLADAGITPDAVYGCSAGALNAAFLADAPGPDRAEELVDWWCGAATHRVLAPTGWGRLLGFAAAALGGGRALFDERPLRRLVEARIGARRLEDLQLPLTVATTCLDCGSAAFHTTGSTAANLVATCALPGIFPPVRLDDGHRHVDGGVPLAPAVQQAQPSDRIFVLDCGLAPVTCSADDPDGGCTLTATGTGDYRPPTESYRGLLQTVLDAFTVSRAVANRAAVGEWLPDPRVAVLPHVSDAWAAGLLTRLPQGPRDTTQSAELAAAGRRSAGLWLRRREALTPVEGHAQAWDDHLVPAAHEPRHTVP